MSAKDVFPGIKTGKFVINLECLVCKTKPGIGGGEAAITIDFGEITNDGGIALSTRSVLRFNRLAHKQPQYGECAVFSETLRLKNITFVPGDVVPYDVKELKVKGLSFKRMGDYFTCGFNPPVDFSLIY